MRLVANMESRPPFQELTINYYDVQHWFFEKAQLKNPTRTLYHDANGGPNFCMRRLKHSVQYSFILFLKALSRLSFVILAQKSLTNTNHHLLRNVQTIKKANLLGEIAKHRNFNFVSKTHLGRRNSQPSVHERHEKKKESLIQILVLRQSSDLRITVQ